MASDEENREYDSEYTDDLAPHLRVRLGYSHDRGTVIRRVWWVPEEDRPNRPPSEENC